VSANLELFRTIINSDSLTFTSGSASKSISVGSIGGNVVQNYILPNKSAGTYTLATTADIPTISTSMSSNRLIGRYATGSGVMQQITIGSGLTLTGAGVLNNTAQATTLGYYGAWQDNFTQTASASNVGYPLIFRTIDLENQVRVVSNGTNLTRITFDNTGIYNLQFSAQIQNADNAQHDVSIWIRKNGVDVPGSAGFVSVPPRKSAGAGNEGHTIAGWNYLLSVVAGQYYEIVWSTTNATHVTIQFYTGANPPPSTASVLATVTQQSGIMAGTGITAINNLVGTTQSLVTGTAGTDFTISSTASTHTFNLPTSSASNRGLLSSADWTTFNNSFELNLLRQNVAYIQPQGLVNVLNGFNVSPNISSWALVLSGNTATGGIGGFVRFDTTATAGTLAFRRGSFGIVLGAFQFEYTQKVRFQTNLTGQRGLWGLSAGYTFATPTNVEPNTNVNVVGVCQLSTSTNLHIIHNDGTGTATTFDLGANYPCNTNIYTYYIRIKRTTADYTITVERITNTDNSSISNVYTTSTNIPAIGVASFSPINYITNNAQSATASYFDGGCIAKITHQ